MQVADTADVSNSTLSATQKKIGTATTAKSAKLLRHRSSNKGQKIQAPRVIVFRAALKHKSKILGGKIAQIRKHIGQITGAQAKPFR